MAVRMEFYIAQPELWPRCLPQGPPGAVYLTGGGAIPSASMLPLAATPQLVLTAALEAAAGARPGAPDDGNVSCVEGNEASWLLGARPGAAPGMGNQGGYEGAELGAGAYAAYGVPGPSYGALTSGGMGDLPHARSATPPRGSGVRKARVA